VVDLSPFDWQPVYVDEAWWQEHVIDEGIEGSLEWKDFKANPVVKMGAAAWLGLMPHPQMIETWRRHGAKGKRVQRVS
jgi:hypothetical protein